MTRVMLIVGVAALAIAAPAAAGPHGHGDHGGGNGGGHASASQRPNRGGGGGFKMQAPRMQRAPVQRMSLAQRGHEGGARVQRQSVQRQRNGERQAMQRQRNVERQATRQRGAERQVMQRERKNQRQAIVQQRDRQRQAIQQRKNQRQAMMQQHNQQRQAQAFALQQRQAQARFNPALDRRQLADNRMQQGQMRNRTKRYALPHRQLAANFVPRYANYRRRDFIAPADAMRLVGVPVSRAGPTVRFAELPRSVRYLYPDTPDRYYRYGDGYIYQIDRSNDVIDSLLPLVAGGFLPGMTFPAQYMTSYVPAAYGFDSFYPDTPYTNYRYLDGNVYSVDPYSGAIEDVIPTYAYGYGVGQMLPAGYNYYNVPAQYRSMYYDTADYDYRYAPGAIYQVDPGSQMITGVASLLSPGLAVGQPLPAGYGMYNVPMAYRSTYYDTPNAWYRYNNGYIYQVDPTTQLVTAVVRSLLA